VDDPAQDGEDAVVGVGALFELDVLVPEWMSKEV
jgi:hypothetical protein